MYRFEFSINTDFGIKDDEENVTVETWSFDRIKAIQEMIEALQDNDWNVASAAAQLFELYFEDSDEESDEGDDEDAEAEDVESDDEAEEK